jgi:hypothetical protein
MRKFSLGLVVGLLFAFGISLASSPRFRVAVGKDLPPKVVMGATVSGGSPMVNRDNICVRSDGSALIMLAYQLPSGSTTGRVLFVPANASLPIVDSNSNQVSATVPAALANAISTFASQIDSMIATAAAGGKINL